MLTLKALHETHIGSEKMKQLARRHVYWTNLNKDIENFVRSCDKCAENKSAPRAAPKHSWEAPTDNFERVHMDYAGPFEGHHIFVVIDAKSKWAEISCRKSAPTSESTIEELIKIFARHGLPTFLVSDNATIFKSEEFKNFCTRNGIQQRLIAPMHPATNGQCERLIQTLKQKLKAMGPTEPLQERIRKFLTRYYITPQANGKSPSEMYLNRQIRTSLNNLKPLKKGPFSNEVLKGVRSLNQGDVVFAKFMENSREKWKKGIIQEKHGKLHYKVMLLHNNYSLLRHINQLKWCPTPETENPTEPETQEEIKIQDNVSEEEDLAIKLLSAMKSCEPSLPAPLEKAENSASQANSGRSESPGPASKIPRRKVEAEAPKQATPGRKRAKLLSSAQKAFISVLRKSDRKSQPPDRYRP